MNKTLFILLSFGILYSSQKYDGSTLAPVVIAGSVIKSSGIEIVSKHKRKDCPVCKGKGWYISGDQISKVDCGYCEPETKEAGLQPLSTHSIEKTRVYKK
jgi:hypothetical protein